MNKEQLNKIFKGLQDGTLVTPELQALVGTELDLSGVKLGYYDMLQLALILPHIPNLEVLNLNNCNIGNTGVALVLDALAHLKNLKVLDLGYNGIRFFSVEKLAPHQHLEVLNLDGNVLNSNKYVHGLTSGGEPVDGCIVTTLAAELPPLHELKVLSLSSTLFPQFSLSKLADSLTKFPNLQVLNLSKNEVYLTDEVIQALSHAKHLIKLDLSDNFIRPAEIQKMEGSETLLKHSPVKGCFVADPVKLSVKFGNAVAIDVITKALESGDYNFFAKCFIGEFDAANAVYHVVPQLVEEVFVVDVLLAIVNEPHEAIELLPVNVAMPLGASRVFVPVPGADDAADMARSNVLVSPSLVLGEQAQLSGVVDFLVSADMMYTSPDWYLNVLASGQNLSLCDDAA